MRTASTLSALLHIGLIAGAWALMSLEPAVDENAAESVSVDIISMDALSVQPSDMVTATNQSLVSAGADHEAAEVPETAQAEPVETQPTEVVEIAETEPLQEIREAEAAQPVTEAVVARAAETIEPTETEDQVSAAVLAADAVSTEPVDDVAPQVVDAAASVVEQTVAPTTSDPLSQARLATLADLASPPSVQPLPPAQSKTVEATEPTQTASLGPVIEESVDEIAPVPLPRISRKPVASKPEPVKEEPKASEPTRTPPTRKAVEQPQQKPPTKQANLGNGGASDADTAASKRSGGGQGKQDNGGSAAVSKYPGLVQAKVARAAKRPKGSSAGEAVVSFTLNASGNVARVALARSSGNAAVDQAALAAVDRAAPFPPIPADAGRSTWQFNVPIYFQR